MSVERRKIKYEQYKGTDKLSEALKAEFGDPSETKPKEEPKVEPKEEPIVVPKKKVKKHGR